MNAPETQDSITDWAAATFGREASTFRVLTRANEEMAELLSALSSQALPEVKTAMAIAEVADVMIVLCRAGKRYEIDLDIATPSYSSVPNRSAESMAASANRSLAELIQADVMQADPGTKLRFLWTQLKGMIEALGGTVQGAIDAKMAINRKRKWRLNGDGTAYHEKVEA